MTHLNQYIATLHSYIAIHINCPNTPVKLM